MSLGRGLVTLEGTIHLISPKLNIMEVLSEHLRDSFDPSRIEKKLRRMASQGIDSAEAMTALPSKTVETLDMVQKGQVRIGMELSGSEEFSRDVREQQASSAFDDSVLIIVLCTPMNLVGKTEATDEPIALGMERHLRSGRITTVSKLVQRESTLMVTVNGIPTMRICCSASHLAELACGRLFTEGLVRNLDEIETITLHDDPLRVDVELAGRTWGSHSAYLADKSGVLYLCEDIGRHNAFDKAIGCALLDGVDLKHSLMFTSGRVPTDMAVKAVRAGLPLLVSKAVATDKTIEMARTYDLTLICRASSSSFDVVSEPGRM